MTDSTKQRQDAVMDLSVYNALQIRDMTAAETLALLQRKWKSGAPLAPTLDADAVNAALARLAESGAVQQRGETYVLPFRGSNGRGRQMRMNADRTAISVA